MYSSWVDLSHRLTLVAVPASAGSFADNEPAGAQQHLGTRHLKQHVRFCCLFTQTPVDSLTIFLISLWTLVVSQTFLSVFCALIGFGKMHEAKQFSRNVWN